ncbi:hypothetical protein ACIBL5_01860 [Streptomyces sp. NPDC050516]|uniref:hypothetical protein n=1 Tax=Streptomyces sp. NPDC050516 TaxID=3365621 RepID=UPI0037936828
MQPRELLIAPVLPEALRPLAEELNRSGVTINWNLGAGEQQQLQGLVRRHGRGILVDRASERTRPGGPPKPARYWLKVWGDLDRASAHTVPRITNVLPMRPATARNHTDTLTAGLALLEEQQGIAQ